MDELIGTEGRLPFKRWVSLSFQHLFSMLGGLVVAPLIIGINPSATMFCSGAGTLFYLFITKKKMPIFLCTSFAYTAPLLIVREKYGVEGMMFGVLTAGLMYVLLSLLVRLCGTGWIRRLMPPVVTASVMIVIGLSPALTAVGWAGYNASSGAAAALEPSMRLKWIAVSTITLLVGILGTTCFRGIFSVIPVMLALIAGYAASLVLGVVSPSAIAEAISGPVLALPKLCLPRANMEAAFMTAPLALVTVGEHIADVTAAGNVCRRDFIHDPGLHRSLLGDGVASVIAAFFGGAPVTTYSENIGIMALTKVCSVSVVFLAACIAIVISFFAPVNAVITGIPTPVLGGISILLFGIIAITGIRIYMDAHIDFSSNRNAVIALCVIVLGLGGASISFHTGGLYFEMPSIAVATFTGIFLNLLLPGDRDQLKPV